MISKNKYKSYVSFSFISIKGRVEIVFNLLIILYLKYKEGRI